MDPADVITRLRRLGFNDELFVEFAHGIGLLLGYTTAKQESHLHWQLAYLGRYGRIPPSEVMDWPIHRTRALLHEVSEIIKKENERPKDVLSQMASDDWR